MTLAPHVLGFIALLAQTPDNVFIEIFDQVFAAEAESIAMIDGAGVEHEIDLDAARLIVARAAEARLIADIVAADGNALAAMIAELPGVVIQGGASLMRTAIKVAPTQAVRDRMIDRLPMIDAERVRRRLPEIRAVADSSIADAMRTPPTFDA